MTDGSSCICVIVRPLLIWLDYQLTDKKPYELAQLKLRAERSATNDVLVISNRLAHLVNLAYSVAKNAPTKYGRYVAKEHAKVAACYAMDVVERSVYITAYDAGRNAAYCALRGINIAVEGTGYLTSLTPKPANDEIIHAALRCLDQMLPPLTSVSDVVVERAQQLMTLQNS